MLLNKLRGQKLSGGRFLAGQRLVSTTGWVWSWGRSHHHEHLGLPSLGGDKWS